jgi:phage repressor protein C with HTH and peptisase S24 domain
MDGIEQRSALTTAISASGEPLAALSRMLGRNAAWLQQYLRRGTPRLLPEDDRRRLAAYLGIADSALGGPEGPVILPRLDIAASAGPGRVAGGEAIAGGEPIAPETLRRLGAAPATCGWIRVEGDSMAPLLAHGDQILVDRARRQPDRRGSGLWVLRLDGELRVKRVRADRGQLVLSSENADYAEEVRAPGEIEIVGKVLRMTRDL